MTVKLTTPLLLFFILLTVVAGVVVYPQLPEQVASHWNAQGQADGTMSKFWGIFLLPMIMGGMFLLYFFIPRVDPLKSNIESFRKYYDAFWILMFLFFVYIFSLTLAWNLGYRFSFTLFMIPALAALWYVLGAVLEKSKRNWFMGIRTPWTLSSDEVWDKTHKLGGKLFKFASLVSLAGLLFRDGTIVFIFIIAPMLLVTLITVAYSYISYRQMKK